MQFIINRLRALVRGESGQDLLEYALLVALIALVAVGAVEIAGDGVNTIFTDIGNELQNPGGSTP
jgi:pilus assembly protein Flp/PilA